MQTLLIVILILVLGGLPTKAWFCDPPNKWNKVHEKDYQEALRKYPNCKKLHKVFEKFKKRQCWGNVWKDRKYREAMWDCVPEQMAKLEKAKKEYDQRVALAEVLLLNQSMRNDEDENDFRHLPPCSLIPFGPCLGGF